MRRLVERKDGDDDKTHEGLTPKAARRPPLAGGNTNAEEEVGDKATNEQGAMKRREEHLVIVTLIFPKAGL